MKKFKFTYLLTHSLTQQIVIAYIEVRMNRDKIYNYVLFVLFTLIGTVIGGTLLGFVLGVVFGATIGTLIGAFISLGIMDFDYDWYYFKYYYYRYYWCYYWCFVSVNEAITIYWNDFKVKCRRVVVKCRRDFKVKCRRIEESKPVCELVTLCKPDLGFLPEELILTIFQYTSKKELFNLLQVNHKFHRIGYDKSLLGTFLGPFPQAPLGMLIHNFLYYYYSDTPYKRPSYSPHCVLTPTEIREIIGTEPLCLSHSQKTIFYSKTCKTIDTIPRIATQKDLKRLKTEVTNQHLYELLLNSKTFLWCRMHYTWPKKLESNSRRNTNNKEEFIEVVLNFSEYLLQSINQLEFTPIDDFRMCNGIVGCEDHQMKENDISDRLYCLIFLLQICKVFKSIKHIYRLVTQTKLLDRIIAKYGIVECMMV